MSNIFVQDSYRVDTTVNESKYKGEDEKIKTRRKKMEQARREYEWINSVPDLDIKLVSARFKLAREMRGITVSKMAALIMQNNSSVARMESGKGVWNTAVLYRAVSALDISIDWLFGRTLDMNAHKSKHISPLTNEGSLKNE